MTEPTESPNTEPKVEESVPTESATESSPTGELTASAPTGESETGQAASADGAEEPEGSASSPGTEAAGPDGAPKRKRRRRRKKKPGDAAQAGEAGGADGGTEAGGGPAPARREPHTPFKRFFEGEKHAERRHAFSAGELVAGRVTSVTDHVIVIDLFGKALAVIDRWDAVEPEEIPADAPPVTDAQAQEAESLPETPAEPVVAAPAEVDGVVVIPAIAVVDAPISEQDVADALEAVEAEADAAEEGDDETNEAEGAAAEAASAPVLELEPEGEPPEAPPVGSIRTGRVASVSESGTIAIVNRYVPRAETKAKLMAARDARQRVRGIVFGFNRGGFDVLVHGLRAFCPANGMSLGPIDDPRSLFGEKLEFTIPPRKGKAKGIVVSRRTLLEREALRKRKAVLRELAEGQVLTGRVTQVREFGAFVDIGEGLEGMVHQSELDWRHGVRPADVLKPDDEVQVKVLGVKREGKKLRNTRIGLSIKALKEDPWEAHAATLREGAAVK
ncbi:MAG: S1 RNA-binding domain-containing protein, partial [Myxococcales bacterium]|nr:S1 RNA-binding domain-containing protein [Myxococcales bacterium]